MKLPKSDINKYTKFICVDEDNRPMSWGGDQLCYCTSSQWQDIHTPLEIYTKSHAQKLITRTQIFRRKNGFVVGAYRIMPVLTKNKPE